MAALLGSVYVGVTLGVDAPLAVNVVTVGTGAGLLLAERWWPRHPEWATGDPDLWQDVGHMVFGFALGSVGGAALADAAVPEPVWGLWPSGWPLAVQAVLGLVVAEFFQYWQHRLSHTVPALWWIHVLHHSPTRMTFLKTTRIHALDVGSFTFLTVAPLLALGAPLPVVLSVTAFGNFVSPLQHANVHMRTPRWLNHVFGTPAAHWLHHSIDKRQGHSNFGMNLMCWDHLFGTFMDPTSAPTPGLGIEPNPVPPGFLGQLLLPLQGLSALRWRRGARPYTAPEATGAGE
ncbi:MAG: sterol desaturase family protein [Vicinamibacterales bacterium]